NFSENHWLYTYWMPYESIDTEKHTGMRTISRFTYDPQEVTIDQDSRVDLLELRTQIHSCCHAGGGMAFDDAGNLYVSTGDNNSSGGSSISTLHGMEKAKGKDYIKNWVAVIGDSTFMHTGVN